MKELTIEITNKCSLNCLHCSTNAVSNGKLFFSAEQVKKILKEFSDFKKIRLSGGEPFEHPDLKSILSLIKNKGRKIEILSSGVYKRCELPLKLLRFCKIIDNIVLSIYGPREIHNKVCNSENSYDSLVKSLDSIISVKIPFSFHFVAMKENFDYLESVVKYVSGINSSVDYCNVGLHVLRFIKQGRGKLNSDHALSKCKVRDLIEKVKNLSKKYGTEVTMSNSFTRKRCDCGSRKAVVTAYGERIFCSALKYGAKQEKFACQERV